MNQPGHHRNRHYTEWVADVKQLKRDGKLDEALELLGNLMTAVEREFDVEGHGLATWYYEQTAIIHRKRRDYGAEVAVLERLGSKDPSALHENLAARLRKARELAEQARQVESSACPSCGKVLEPPPARSRRCPSCRDQIVVQRNNGMVSLKTVSEAEADSMAAAKRAVRERHLVRANRIGWTDADFEQTESELGRKFGSAAGTGDVFWTLANRAVANRARDGDFYMLGVTYREMASFLVEEGRTWYDLAALAVQAETRMASQWTDAKGLADVVGCACPACSEPPRTLRILELADSTAPLPHANCQDPPCTCRYHARRDTYEATIPVERHR